MRSIAIWFVRHKFWNWLEVSKRGISMSAGTAITGVGPVTSIGVGKEAAWEGICAQRCNLATVSQRIGDEFWEDYLMAEVPPVDQASTGISEKEIYALTGERNNRDLLLLSTAANLALRDSGVSARYQSRRVGLVLAHENPGFDEYTRQIWDALASDPPTANEALLEHMKRLYAKVKAAGYRTHSFVLLQQLTRILDLHGPSLAVNNACASGLYALEAATHWIRAGHADAMVVVAGDSPRLLTRYLWLKAAQACSPDGLTRPFDRHRNGFVLGEGAGAVVIEDMQTAAESGAKIYTEYQGGAFRCDGWKLNIPCASPHFYAEAIKAALQQTGTAARNIDLVVPHGAGSPLHDRYEAIGLTEVFGRDAIRPLITALKPYVGHTLAGSSIIELVLALLGLSHGIVPATLNWKTADPQLGVQPVDSPRSADVKTWMKTATGFGGFHAACVFTQPGAQA
jgi:3-oxoacyl-[acyl-carrier-protein] synthase II